jgi:hypothetical protein
MGRYYFHLQDGRRLLEDHEGHECRSLEDARAYAIATARDIMVGEMRAGRLNLSWSILVSGNSGDVIDRISFGDAVQVVEP